MGDALTPGHSAPQPAEGETMSRGNEARGPGCPTHVLRPAVLALMVGSVAWSLGQVIRLYAPGWNATYLVVACVLAAVEAYYAWHLFQTRTSLRLSALQFRVIELLALYILVRAGHYVTRGWDAFLADVRAWPDQVDLLMTLETLATYVLVFFCWEAATRTAMDLSHIGEPPERARGYVPPVQRITSRFFFGGAVLLVASGVAQNSGVATLLDLDRPPARGLVLNVLLYFLLGMVLLGQARFLELRERWQQERIQVTASVAGRWARYSLLLVGLAALLAFLLPTGFAGNWLDALATPFGWLASALSFLTSLAFTLFLLPISWLYWLMQTLLGRPAAPPQMDMPPFQPPPSAAGPSATPDWLLLLRTIALWALLLGMLLVVARRFIQDRTPWWSRRGRPPLRQLLRRAWTALWAWLRGLTRTVGQAVGQRLPRRLPGWPGEGLTGGRSWRFFRLGGLSPRERILYYYLSILKRARRQGYPRPPTRTPYEYKGELAPHLPEAVSDWEALTEAFVEVRYSRHAVPEEEDRTVRSHWKRVRAVLRRLRK